MQLQFFLGAYWESRKEPLAACAAQLAEFYAKLSKCDQTLSRWYALGRSKGDALQRSADVTSSEYWVKRLRSDEPNKGSGYGIGVWNGQDGSAACASSVSCGSYSQVLVNSVVINLPDVLQTVGKVDVPAKILEVVAGSWNPQWAGVISKQACDLRSFSARRPFVDWMIYLSDDLLPVVPTLKPPARCKRVDDLGTLIVVQPEPTDPTNREHLRNIERVQTALEKVWTVADDE